MIGSARPVGRAVKCEDDDTDWSAGRTEELIVRADYPISVIEQVLCVLQARLPRCRVDIDRHPPAGGRPDELCGPGEARPLRRRRRVLLLQRSHCRSCGRFDRMTHGQISEDVWFVLPMKRDALCRNYHGRASVIVPNAAYVRRGAHRERIPQPARLWDTLRGRRGT